jgi:hypothetical protein
LDALKNEFERCRRAVVSISDIIRRVGGGGGVREFEIPQIISCSGRDSKEASSEKKTEALSLELT